MVAQKQSFNAIAY